MQAEQHAMALHQAMARRACIRMTMADGYCYYGVVQTIGGASVYPQPEAQLLPQGCFSFLALDIVSYQPKLDVQSASTIFGFKVLCVLVPALFILGSWAAFKFVWNITPAIRAEMNARKAAAVSRTEE